MNKAAPKRIAVTLGLIALSYVVSVAGRWLLDMAIQSAPSWTNVLERFGGWLIGLVGVVVVVVVLPMFPVWGVLEQKQTRARGTQQ